MNTVLVQWFSKKHSAVETLVLSTEFVTITQHMYALRGLTYKLRMMGISMSGPLYMYGENMSVVHNTFTLQSVLRRESNSVCYHAVHESVALGESLVRHIAIRENVADLMTHVLHGHKRRYIFRVADKKIPVLNKDVRLYSE